MNKYIDCCLKRNSNISDLQEDYINNRDIILIKYKEKPLNETLNILNNLKSECDDSNLIFMPFLVGYDTIINQMHNYHLLVPKILSMDIENSDDLFALYQIVSFINQEMYDEYDMIRKKLSISIENLKHKDELYELVVLMAVSNKFINPKYLNYIKECNIKRINYNNIKEKYIGVIRKRGYYDLPIY